MPKEKCRYILYSSHFSHPFSFLLFFILLRYGHSDLLILLVLLAVLHAEGGAP